MKTEHHANEKTNVTVFKTIEKGVGGTADMAISNPTLIANGITPEKPNEPGSETEKDSLDTKWPEEHAP